MDEIVSLIAEVLRNNIVCACGNTGEDMECCRYVAQRVAEALHLEQILVREGEIPPLYAIEGWMRGSND